MKRTNFLNIGLRDILNGALIAILTSIGTSLLTILDGMQETGVIEFNLETLKVAGVTALIAGLSYILKNVLSNEQGQLLKK